VSTESALDLLRKTFITAGIVAGPMILAALIVGLIVGVLQAATQINEASISFVTKLLAVTATFALFGAWSLEQLTTFAALTFASMADVVR
jgi:flagellar biosynthesis protein FliQ